MSVTTGTADIAANLWNGSWKMPTKDEFTALIDGLSSGAGTGTTLGLVWTWCDGSSTQYVSGCTLKGYKVSGKAGSTYASNSLFLPAAGSFRYSNKKVSNAGDYGNYWYSTPTGSSAWSLYFSSVSQSVVYYSRKLGYSVRAVLVD